MISSIALVLLGAAAAATPCENLTNVKLDNATITSARMVPEGPAPAPAGGRGRGAGAQAAGAPQPAGTPRGGNPPPAPALIPAHCQLQIVLKPSSDSLINMEMWLPPADKWNGKFMGVGNGGFAGSIRYDSMRNPLLAGSAVASTDDGHEGPAIGAAGADWAYGHPEKIIDYGHRAVHLTALAAKALTLDSAEDVRRLAAGFLGADAGARRPQMGTRQMPETDGASDGGSDDAGRGQR